VSEYPDQAYQYDIILRSDLDAFLTPGWAAWVPEHRHTMYVGKGGFIQGEEKHGLQTLKRLAYAAERMGLPEPKVINPGTSWVGDGKLLITAARLQSEAIRWLHRYEFVEFDRCCAGMTGWPNWHYKVSVCALLIGAVLSVLVTAAYQARALPITALVLLPPVLVTAAYPAVNYYQLFPLTT
jgi:hypothetical protein